MKKIDLFEALKGFLGAAESFCVFYIYFQSVLYIIEVGDVWECTLLTGYWGNIYRIDTGFSFALWHPFFFVFNPEAT